MEDEGGHGMSRHHHIHPSCVERDPMALFLPLLLLLSRVDTLATGWVPCTRWMRGSCDQLQREKKRKE